MNLTKQKQDNIAYMSGLRYLDGIHQGTLPTVADTGV
jgi:hypothetical protein